jgi:uncharacterized protein (DUF1684 family)
MEPTVQQILDSYDPALPLAEAFTIPGSWYTDPRLAAPRSPGGAGGCLTRRGTPFALFAALAAAFSLAALAGANDYEAEIEAWRAQREARLEADGGWLTVAGLFWLKEGENRFGSASDNDIVLPASAAGHAGVFEFHGGSVAARIESGVTATVAGKPVTAVDMHADTSGSPETLVLGPLSMHVVERGGRYGIRLKDNESPARKAFKGLQWFPVSEAYRVTARFVPFSPPKSIPIPNVLGQVSEMPSPGYVAFTLGGQELRLDPVLEEPDADELFIIFRDGTTGKETYGAGRFLYTEKPRDGHVILDFNKAYSPPCAFTPYATCPLPPKQNRLSVRIEAGEKSHDTH